MVALAGVVATAQAVSGNTKRAACPDLGITGSYSSRWGDVELDQQGCTVTCRYAYQDGRIAGTIDGNMVRYAWTENDGAGRGVFVVASDGELVGTWGTGNDDSSGGWRLEPVRATATSAIAH